MSNYSSTVTKYGDKWRVDFRYKSPVDGKVKQSCKRGFKLQKEAKAWEKNELPVLIKKLEGVENPVLVMTMGELIEKYLESTKLEFEETTMETKISIINKNILPFFKDKKVFDIKKSDIQDWKNYMLSSTTRLGKPYSNITLRTISTQLSAIFNYAIAIYDLPENPVQMIKRLGKKESAEKTIWTVQEYLKFSKAVQEKPSYYYAYEVMFWCGLRLGEVLGLTSQNVDCENKIIYIEQSFKKGQLGNLKTTSSKREIRIPDDLAEKLREYKDSCYCLQNDTRLFTMSKSSLHNIKDATCEKIGLKRITLHEIRHSHISLLVNSVRCASIKDIAKRAGHKNPTMTLNTYTHSYNDKDIEIANELNVMMGGINNVRKEQG